jgi:hypothetical protein
MESIQIDNIVRLIQNAHKSPQFESIKKKLEKVGISLNTAQEVYRLYEAGFEDGRNSKPEE